MFRCILADSRHFAMICLAMHFAFITCTGCACANNKIINTTQFPHKENFFSAVAFGYCCFFSISDVDKIENFCLMKLKCNIIFIIWGNAYFKPSEHELQMADVEQYNLCGWHQLCILSNAQFKCSFSSLDDVSWNPD